MKLVCHCTTFLKRMNPANVFIVVVVVVVVLVVVVVVVTVCSSSKGSLSLSLSPCDDLKRRSSRKNKK